MKKASLKTLLATLTLALLAFSPSFGSLFTEDYGIIEDDGSLSAADTKRCFGALGLNYEKLTFKFPKKTGVTYTAKLYEQGKLAREPITGTTVLDKGLQSIFIFIKEKDGRVVFSLSAPSSGSGLGSIPRPGPYATSSGRGSLKKLGKEPQLVYTYAENHEKGISGILTAEEDVEQNIANHEYLLLVYMSLEDVSE